jgi:hypothetical protein
MPPTPSAPDMRLLNSLPHRDSLRLPADDSAPGDARRRIAKVLPQWSLEEFGVVASLIASELLTNGVAATRKARWARVPPVRLWLRGGPGLLAILAWDATRTAPAPREAGQDDENGRGLTIVATLSADCGYYHPQHHGGKVTWALIDHP